MMVPTASPARLRQLFEQQLVHAPAMRATTVRQRRARLKALQHALIKYRTHLQEAMYADFSKPAPEVDLVELYPTIREIKHVCRHLHRWLAPQRVPTPLPLLGTRSWIRYEPKGVTLILSPWNFPINLTFIPLVSAIAGGNTAILKPSEHTPHTTQAIAELVHHTFDESEVALVQGGPDIAQALLDLPFHHIFFTGAPQIGKLVMAAAAKHLASVTLELGGKSPTIVDQSAHIPSAARRIAIGKYLNDGQICIAPDYVLVHESVKDELVEALQRQVATFYTDNPKHSPWLCRIVNDRHFHRLSELLHDAANKGASLISLGQADPASRFLPPTLVLNPSPNTRLMQEEIFGPLLPILTFKHLEEAVTHVNQGEKPLALYIFSKNRSHINYVLTHTRAGGTAINAVGIHFYNNYLPFGGSNFSGIGKSHGKYGFLEFTNARAVTEQRLPGIADVLSPPYTTFKQRIITWALKWF